jgi:CNT family concentrative nucleoside transporter
MGISAGHLLSASLMSAPAAVVIAKLMVPEREKSATMGHVNLRFQIDEVNAFEAACKGASEGLKLALNVAAMLIAFIALVALVNVLLGSLGGLVGLEISVEKILSYIFMPLAWTMGVPWEDCPEIGRLLGEKMVINEFLAFAHLGELIKEGAISARAETIATYALCGFANFSSVAIQIGGIGELEPNKKSVFALFGLRAMIGGTLAAFMTACIAGILL